MGDARGPSGVATGTDPLATADSLTPGTVIASRYRVERQVFARGPLSLWRGDDLVLARPVAVHVLTGDVDAAYAHRFIHAAVAAGQVFSPAATATFDADDLGDLSYVVSEWVEGVSLAQLLNDGPLPTGRMRGLLLPVATLLAEAHARGVHHGRLQPSDVVVSGHGGVKVLGLGLLIPDGTQSAAELSDDDPADRDGASQASSPPRTLSTSAEEGADVRALGALVYASLTGRWPLNGTDLPPAPLDEAGRVCAPRQVRAGVSRQADAIATAALGLDGRQTVAPLRSAAEVAAALDSLPYDQDPPTPPVAPRAQRPATAFPPPRRPVSPAYARPAPRRRRISPLAAGVVLIVAIAAVVSVVLALHSGSNPSSPTPPVHASTSTQPPTSATVLTPAAYSDFDPYGHPPTEQPQLVPLAHDNNPGTAWLTETYTNAQLGSLKPGVGLRLDMGRPVTIRQVQLTFPFAGQSVELRAGDTDDSNSIDSYPVVWSDPSAGTSALATPNTTAPHRYWVIWLTRLVPQNGGFQGGVSEVVVRS